MVPSLEYGKISTRKSEGGIPSQRGELEGMKVLEPNNQEEENIDTLCSASVDKTVASDKGEAQLKTM